MKIFSYKNLKWIKSALMLFCMIGLMASFAPQPAAAKSFGKICGSHCSVTDSAIASIKAATAAIIEAISAAKVAVWAKIVSMWNVIYGYIEEYLGILIPDMTFVNGAMKMMSKNMHSETQLREEQAVVDGKAKDAYTKNVVRALSKAPMPMEENQMMCRAGVSCQAPALMNDYVEALTNMITDSIMEATKQGNGPAYVYAALKGRCGGAAGGVKTASAADGYSEDCVAASPAVSMGAADADISASTLSPDNVFQLPTMTQVSTEVNGQTVTRALPSVDEGSSNERDKAEKKAFLTAVQYCTNLAAAHEKGPTGKQLDTVGGRVKKAMLDTYETRKESLVRVCAKRVAQMTRPDCSDSQFAEICEATLHSCNAARTNKMDKQPSLRGCTAGMSYFQAEQVCVEGCLSSKQSEARAAYEAGAGDIMKSLDQCAQSQAEYKNLMALREEELTHAISALQVLEMNGL